MSVFTPPTVLVRAKIDETIESINGRLAALDFLDGDVPAELTAKELLEKPNKTLTKSEETQATRFFFSGFLHPRADRSTC